MSTTRIAGPLGRPVEVDKRAEAQNFADRNNMKVWMIRGNSGESFTTFHPKMHAGIKLAASGYKYGEEICPQLALPLKKENDGR